MKGDLDNIFKRIVVMTSLTDGNVFLNGTADGFVIFHTFNVYALVGTGKLQFMLKFLIVPLVRFVNRLLKGLNSSGITFDFPIQDSFEDSAGISPLHRRVGWVLNLARLSDLVGELFDGSIVLILHTLIMARTKGKLKQERLSSPMDKMYVK